MQTCTKCPEFNLIITKNNQQIVSLLRLIDCWAFDVQRQISNMSWIFRKRTITYKYYTEMREECEYRGKRLLTVTVKIRRVGIGLVYGVDHHFKQYFSYIMESW